MRNVKDIYKPLPFWSWNGTLEEEELCRQIDRMHENGIGGFFMHARGGLKTPYLGEKWFSCVEACARRAKELGMQAYAYDENGWPSGFAGGKLLEDEENHDRSLSHKMGAFDPHALASFEIRGDRLVRVTSSDGECLNVYDAPSPSTADILNGDVVDKFIALTHEEYKKRDKFGIKGFFTDEPQYFRWGFPFFAGTLPLRTTVTAESTAAELVLDRFHLVDVSVNGASAGRMMFSRRLDISHLLRTGENTVDLDICIGNRNLFGPFHTRDEEPVAVGPGTWERFTTWRDGKSPLVVPDYAFVKSVLD